MKSIPERLNEIIETLTQNALEPRKGIIDKLTVIKLEIENNHKAIYHDDWDNRRPMVAVDFDATICHYKEGWKGTDEAITEEPIPGSLEFLNSAACHFDITIFSARCNSKEGILQIMTWLGRNGIVASQFHYHAGKPSAFAFIDDRAIQFDGNWEGMLEKLMTFRPWYYSDPGYGR